MGYNALVIGGGGREHELGRQLQLADDIERIYFADGNAGTEGLSKGENVDVKPTQIDELVALAQAKEAGLTVIGPEAPLAMGLSDRLRGKGLKVFGPSTDAARLESSKGYAIQFMERHGIAHPPSIFTTMPHIALNYIKSLGANENLGAENCVIKADGLASGKGVVLPEASREISAYGSAERAVFAMLYGELFDGAGKEGIVVQERYHGPEVSVFVVSDGRRFTVLPAAQDHKRLLDGDEGPNTGGMGAYAPVPPSILSANQYKKIEDIAERTIKGMASEGIPYQGLLYLGLMLAKEQGGDPVVIEYNARFGDPETQVVLPVLQNAGVDVHELLRSAADGHLRDISLPANLGSAAVSACMAAKGYPDNPRKGDVIKGLNRRYLDAIIHHGDTIEVDGQTLTNGGRVLYVTGWGDNIKNAADNAYRIINNKEITFDGEQHRSDIAHQARKNT